MRIRKTVSKLLGSAMACASQYHRASPPRDLWAPVAAGASGMGMDVCELNQSPWDVYPNLHLFSTEYQDLEQSIISKKEEAEEVEIKEEKQMVIWESTGGISENAGGILESSDGPIRVCQKPTTSRSSKKKKEKTKKEEDVILCKKNDGKKWFCKRPAQLPNLLCEYHLSQSRSYYNTNKEKEVVSSQYHHVDYESTKRKQKPRGPRGCGVSPYYYYNGFGPSTRRRRSGASDDAGGRQDDTDHMMHVVDKERLDISYSDMDIDEVSDEEIAGELVTDPNEEEKRVRRKRGRKPVKCRSLKSLL